MQIRRGRHVAALAAGDRVDIGKLAQVINESLELDTRCRPDAGLERAGRRGATTQRIAARAAPAPARGAGRRRDRGPPRAEENEAGAPATQNRDPAPSPPNPPPPPPRVATTHSTPLRHQQ